MLQLSNMTRAIKNCGGFGILSFLKAVKLTCDIFIEGGRRRQCTESRTKDSITHGTTECKNFLSAVSSFASFPKSHQNRVETGAGRCYVHSGRVSQPKNAELRNPIVLKKNNCNSVQSLSQ